MQVQNQYYFNSQTSNTKIQSKSDSSDIQKGIKQKLEVKNKTDHKLQKNSATA